MRDLPSEIDYIARLLRAAKGLKGNNLSQMVRHGGRVLPARVRAAARRLAEAEAMAAAPKLARQLDEVSLRRDCQTCVQYLEPLARGKAHATPLGPAASWAAVIVFATLVAVAGLIYLRGQA